VANGKFLKKYRILLAKDFENLRNEPLIFKRHTFKIFYKKTEHTNGRVGISVSSKIANSVMRNRFKRIIRETFRNSILKHQSYDYLVVVNFHFTLKDRPLIEKSEVLKRDLQIFINQFKSVS
jgi:ribonuclease P protein component